MHLLVMGTSLACTSNSSCGLCVVVEFHEMYNCTTGLSLVTAGHVDHIESMFTKYSTVVWFLCVYSSLKKEAKPHHIQMYEPCATYVVPHVQWSNISLAVSRMFRVVFVRFIVCRTIMYAWGHEGLVIESTLLRNVWMYEQPMGHYWMMWLLII